MRCLRTGHLRFASPRSTKNSLRDAARHGSQRTRATHTNTHTNTRTHTTDETRENQNSARTAEKENPSGAAGQPQTSFGRLTEVATRSSGRRVRCDTAHPPCPHPHPTHTHTRARAHTHDVRAPTTNSLKATGPCAGWPQPLSGRAHGK